MQRALTRGDSLRPHAGSRFDPWTPEEVGCAVDMQLLLGNEVQRLEGMRRDVDWQVLCRAGIGATYIKTLLGKRQGAFALTAVHRSTGNLVGFVKGTTFSSYSGVARSSRTVPITHRVAMLDLICTQDLAECKGVGKALFRALLDVAKRTLGAQVLVLEATNSASSFYKLFGFRRVPDACAWPSDSRVAEAQRAFNRRKWTKAELERVIVRSRGKIVYEPGTMNPKRYASYQNAARNTQLGGLWWPQYDRPANNTVIMSLCLGRAVGEDSGYKARWTPRTPAGLLAGNVPSFDKARVGDEVVSLRGNRYGLPARAGTPTPATPSPTAGAVAAAARAAIRRKRRSPSSNAGSDSGSPRATRARLR